MNNYKERIKKLLALGSSPNEKEAQSAIQMAYALMAKYNLSEGDVTQAALHFDDFLTIKRVEGHIWSIRKVLKDFFLVELILRTEYGVGKKLVLLGKPERVTVAKEIFLYLLETLELNWKAFKALNPTKARKETMDMRKHYFRGFINKVYSNLQRSKEKYQAQGLVLLDKDPDIEAYIKKSVTVSQNSTAINHSSVAYQAGMRDGDKIQLGASQEAVRPKQLA